MQKLLTGVIAEEMYGYLEQEKFLREEQKECRRKDAMDHCLLIALWRMAYW